MAVVGVSGGLVGFGKGLEVCGVLGVNGWMDSGMSGDFMGIIATVRGFDGGY